MAEIDAREQLETSVQYLYFSMPNLTVSLGINACLPMVPAKVHVSINANTILKMLSPLISPFRFGYSHNVAGPGPTSPLFPSPKGALTAILAGHLALIYPAHIASTSALAPQHPSTAPLPRSSHNAAVSTTFTSHSRPPAPAAHPRNSATAIQSQLLLDRQVHSQLKNFVDIDVLLRRAFYVACTDVSCNASAFSECDR